MIPIPIWMDFPKHLWRHFGISCQFWFTFAKHSMCGRLANKCYYHRWYDISFSLGNSFGIGALPHIILNAWAHCWQQWSQLFQQIFTLHLGCIVIADHKFLNRMLDYQRSQHWKTWILWVNRACCWQWRTRTLRTMRPWICHNTKLNMASQARYTIETLQ